MLPSSLIFPASPPAECREATDFPVFLPEREDSGAFWAAGGKIQRRDPKFFDFFRHGCYNELNYNLGHSASLRSLPPASAGFRMRM